MKLVIDISATIKQDPEETIPGHLTSQRVFHETVVYDYSTPSQEKFFARVKEVVSRLLDYVHV
jgi:hypothetical protein